MNLIGGVWTSSKLQKVNLNRKLTIFLGAREGKVFYHSPQDIYHKYIMYDLVELLLKALDVKFIS